MAFLHMHTVDTNVDLTEMRLVASQVTRGSPVIALR